MDERVFFKRNLIFDPEQGFEREVINFKMINSVESSRGAYYLEGKILVEMIIGQSEPIFIFRHPQTKKLGTGIIYNSDDGGVLLAIPRKMMDSPKDLDGSEIWPPGLDDLMSFINLIDKFMFEEVLRTTLLSFSSSLN